MSSRVTWRDSQLDYQSYQILHFCWADEANSRKVQCRIKVPADLAHVGLCDRHLGLYRKGRR